MRTLTVVFNTTDRFEDKLKSVLDTMELKKTDNSILLLPKEGYMDAFDWMLKHKGISRVKNAGETFFIIKHMRVQLKPIDFFV